MHEENARRWAEINAEYDPVRGIGCYGEREEVVLSPDVGPVYVPTSMRAEPGWPELLDQLRDAGSLDALIARHQLDEADAAALVRQILAWRAKWDPEFWFEAGLKIRTKQESYQPFRLNYPQRQFLALLLGQFFAGEPVRVVLVKARQWGGSTLVQLLCLWIQTWWRRSWNLAIVAHEKPAAAHIRGMVTTVSRFYPTDLFGTVTLRPYEGQTNIKIHAEREALIGVAAVTMPQSVRSFTYQMLHLSEVGLWKSTQHQNAEDLAQALEGGLVGGEHTVCVLESTAKGVGNFFHRTYMAAVEGDSIYAPFFVAWWQIPEYTSPVADIDAFAATWTKYERHLWELGATAEGIAWYREKLRSMPAGEAQWRMHEEYPSTPEEAFQSTGRRVFHPAYVERARETTKDPAERGTLHGLSAKGPDALEGITWEPSEHGHIRLWKRPGDTLGGLLDLSEYRMTHRYAAFADIGGRWSGADYSVVRILDRAPMCPDLFDEPGPPEVVAVWHGHLDQDLFAWEAARLCAWYDNALLAVEKNSLRRGSGEDEEGVHHLTVLDAIAEVYPHLYYTEKHDDVRGQKWRSYGFHTNRESKELLIDTLNGALRDRLYIEREAEACAEMDYYERKPDGRMGAREGQKDDRVITAAGAAWLALSHMPAPRLVARSGIRSRSREGGAAVFG